MAAPAIPCNGLGCAGRLQCRLYVELDFWASTVLRIDRCPGDQLWHTPILPLVRIVALTDRRGAGCAAPQPETATA